MEEIWKDIKGYEGYYQVSSLGRIRSLDRYIESCDGIVRLYKGKILILKIDKDGYTRIELSKYNKSKFFYVHRLVAEAFISNPNNLPKINHKDCSPNLKENIQVNNSVENLEWCTNQYNNTYGNRLEKFKDTMLKIKRFKTVYQYDLNYNLIKIWSTVMSIQNELGYCESAIRHCCYGKSKSSYGFIWRYEEIN